MPTVVLVDDHEVVRRGMQFLLDAESDLSIVGEATDGLEAVEIVKQLQPDVVVLDVVMPGLNGLEVTKRIVRESPHTKVVLLSMYDNEAFVLEALRSGAKAYVLKGSTSQELIHAIRETAANGYYLSPPLSEHAIQAYIEKAKSIELDSYELLTDREREVFQLMAEGYKTTEIAARLSVSSRTIDVHRSNAMHKLGLRTSLDIARYAIRRGIVPPEGKSVQS